MSNHFLPRNCPFQLTGQAEHEVMWNNYVAGLLVGRCGWVVKQDGVCMEVCWRLAICEGRLARGQLEQKPDGQGASMKAEWATSHG